MRPSSHDDPDDRLGNSMNEEGKEKVEMDGK
jgi:hypothetical protein